MLQEYKTALISVHPKYVRLILEGSKRVEFRRVWAAQPVSHLVLYSTAPDMRVVAILEIQEIVKKSKAGLWELAKQYGGGITRSELRGYFSNKEKGYALIIKEVKPFLTPLKLSDALPGVRAPQSFLYLSKDQFIKIQEDIKIGE